MFAHLLLILLVSIGATDTSYSNEWSIFDSNKTFLEWLVGEADPYCLTGILNDTICCDSSCGTCGQCYSNTTLGDKCCYETILLMNKSCEFNLPSCVYTSYFMFYELLIVCGISTLVSICLTYICCCFGEKKPPVSYNDIIGKYD